MSRYSSYWLKSEKDYKNRKINLPTTNRIRGFRNYLGMLLLLYAVSSCNTYADNSWLTTSNCDAPCWHGIIPGQTDVSKINSLLSNNPYILDQSIDSSERTYKDFTETINFDMQNYQVIGRIDFIEDHVSMIRFSTKDDEKDPLPGISVGSLLDEYGEPQYLLAIDIPRPGGGFLDRVHPIVYLIYPEKGIALVYDAYYMPRDERNRVSPDIGISQLMLFAPVDFPVLLEMGIFSAGGLSEIETRALFQSWNGYGEYAIDH